MITQLSRQAHPQLIVSGLWMGFDFLKRRRLADVVSNAPFVK